MVQKKTENEYEQLKRQNRRRLVGAVVMVVAAGGILASTGSFGTQSAAGTEGTLALAGKGDKHAVAYAEKKHGQVKDAAPVVEKEEKPAPRVTKPVVDDDIEIDEED